MSGEGSRLATPREWSLITTREGEGYRLEGGGRFIPTKKMGRRSFSHAEGGGGTNSFYFI